MNELETSLVILGTGSTITTAFDSPVSVKGKKIGVKSIAFPDVKTFYNFIRYKVRVEDSKGKIHTLTLPPYRWVDSNNLMQAIFDELMNLYSRIGHTSNQSYLIDDFRINNINKPSIAYRPLTTIIYYGSSGLRIKSDGSYPVKDDALSLFVRTASRSNETRFGYTQHELKQKNNITVEESPFPTFLLCDAIKPTYLGGFKRRVLDVVQIPGSKTIIKHFSNSQINLHDFSVDTLMHITFCFQNLQGDLIGFENNVIIHLIVR